MKILVLDGNSSQCLPLIRSFKKAGHIVVLVCPGIFSSGFFSRYPDKKLIWPKSSDYPDKFYQQFISHVEKEYYDFVLGLSDVSTEMLSSHKQEIEKYIQTLVPDYKIYSKAANKYNTMRLCMENDIPCPLTVNEDEIDCDFFKEQLTFPVVVKPKRGVGAVGFSILSNPSDLEKCILDYRKKFGDLLVQEYIPNDLQYTAEVFCDKQSEIKACVISEKKRFFPLKGGTSSCNITIKNDEMISISRTLLKKIGWVGPANIDFILDPGDNTPKVIEINPRVGATVKIAFLSGVDFSNMIITSINNKNIEKTSSYIKGIVLRNLLLDLLWFLFSSFTQKKSTYPGFFKFSGHNIYYQSFSKDDSGPLIGFFMSYVIKYSNLKKLINKFR